MHFLFLLSFAAAALLACMAAWRHREHRAIAVLLSTFLVQTAVLFALDITVLAPLRARLGVGTPWTGWAWAAALLSNALVLVWPAAVLGTALVVYTRRKPWAAVAAWVAAVALYAAVHPIAGDGSQMRFHATTEILAALAAAGMGIAWYRQRSEADAATSGGNVLAVIIVMELLALPAVPRVGILQQWPEPAAVYVIVLAVVVVMQLATLLGRVDAQQHEIKAQGQRLDVVDKGNMRANIVADVAKQKAERAEETATEARDLAENAVLPKDSPPPSSRRPSNGAAPSSRRA